MSSSAYWNSQYRYYMDNQPPQPTSYYNKDFVQKINEARANIDNLVAEKDKSWAATGQKQDEYNAFKGTMSSYNEVYTQSKSEFGIEEHQEDYEKSKKALALAESTLSALPSSINSNSNRVLTQSQREARYNTLADRAVRYRDSLMAKSSAYEEVWKNARENQALYANREIAGQYAKFGELQNQFVMAMNKYNQAEKNLLEGKLAVSDWESRYRTWQHQQYQNEYNVWFNNMSNALTRYTEALKTEQVLAQTQRQMDRYKPKSWDFGGGYIMTGMSGGTAKYFYNGKSISAGRFVEATGAYGVNWDLWNNVWNSGVRTTGVGSDTLEAFNRRSSADSRYDYLFR